MTMMPYVRSDVSCTDPLRNELVDMQVDTPHALEPSASGKTQPAHFAKPWRPILVPVSCINCAKFIVPNTIETRTIDAKT